MNFDHGRIRGTTVLQRPKAQAITALFGPSPSALGLLSEREQRIDARGAKRRHETRHGGDEREEQRDAGVDRRIERLDLEEERAEEARRGRRAGESERETNRDQPQSA